MDKFKLHEQAEVLSDTNSAYHLARKLIEATTLLDNFDRYQDNDADYRESPFCEEVRIWLSQNLSEITPDVDFTTFTGYGELND